MSWFRKKKIFIKAPVKGLVVELKQVPDEVFSRKMLGDGFAVLPDESFICAPIDGKIGYIFPTGHAFGIEGEQGLEVMVHIGIDTVELKGEGFEPLKEAGDVVKAGEAIIKVDFDLIRQRGKETITPVIITHKEENLKLDLDFNQGIATAVLG